MRTTKNALRPAAVSVLLPVYNGLPYLSQAVESVLNQTFTDFELIAVDDGSTDGSTEVLEGFAARDRRLKVVQQSNRGVTAALNRGLREVRAPYVARMDADDIALPDRLAMQLAFMDANPQCGVLGGAAISIGVDGESAGTWTPPTHPDLIRWRLLFSNCLIHPSVLFRTSTVRALGGYDESASTAQDYLLWVRLMKVADLCSLATPVIYKRQWDGRVTRTRNAAQEEVGVQAMSEAIEATTGATPDRRAVQYIRTALRPASWSPPPWSLEFTSADAAAAYEIVSGAYRVHSTACRNDEGQLLIADDARQLLWRITRGTGSLQPQHSLAVRFVACYPRAFSARVLDKILSSVRNASQR